MAYALEGVDFSDGRPGAAALVKAGKHFVVRYVPYGGYAKGLTAAEIKAYHAAGLGIVLNWEQVATRALQGKAAGIADAKTSAAAARALGFPADSPIYFSADFDVTPAQYPAVIAYLRGAASVIGVARVGIYGSYRLMVWCARDKVATWFWQTYAWSYGHLFAGSHLYQYRNTQTINHAGVDFTRALKPDYGQWGAQPVAGGPKMALYSKIAESGAFTILGGKRVGCYSPLVNGTGFGAGTPVFGPQTEPSAASYDYRLKLFAGAVSPVDLIHCSNGVFKGYFLDASNPDVSVRPTPVVVAPDPALAARLATAVADLAALQSTYAEAAAAGSKSSAELANLKLTYGAFVRAATS